MAQHTSMMEWLSQTRRINKSVDQICMETIDAVVKILNYLDRNVVYKNREFFDRFCGYYHKPNPTMLMRRIRKKDQARCVNTCKYGDYSRVLGEFVQGSINRCWEGIEMVKIQWFEVIDFMYERPELVNPANLDEYITDKIYEVCRNNKKLNPLDNGMRKRFGKFYRDNGGRWKHERRRRF